MIFNRDLCRVELRQPPEGEPEDSEKVYLTAIISSGKLDGHGTEMTEKTLRNFAADLKTAIQFKDSHRMGHGFGVSLDGRYEEEDELVIGDFKLLRGLPLNNASYPDSDAFVRSIQEGVITRVSVGFSGGDYKCNICDADWLRGSCYHFPKRKYVVIGDDGKARVVECKVEIDNARLVEVSAVSKGSNPDAMIVDQAERAFREGCLPQDVQMELEEIYGMRFDTVHAHDSGGETVDIKEVQAQLDTVTAERDSALAKVQELEPLAACGKEARSLMAAEALNAYKVSRGENVKEADVERVQKRLDTLTYAELVGERDYYAEQAPDKPEVEPGSQTSQPDRSGDRDGSKKTGRRALIPLHW